MNQNKLLGRLYDWGYRFGMAGVSAAQARKLFRRVLGMRRNESRWSRPHQDAKECRRRRQQMAYDAGLADRRAYSNARD